MWGGASSRGRVSWCVQHMIGYSGIWGSTCNYQGTFSGLFSGQETAEFEEVTISPIWRILQGRDSSRLGSGHYQDWLWRKEG